MENLPYIISSPNSVKLKLSKISKSSSSTRSKNINQPIDQIFEIQNLRFSVTPNKSRQLAFSKEMTRLEEELDIKEIEIINRLKTDFHEESLIKNELKTYEVFIEKIISCITQNDSRIGKCVNRGWTGYQKILQKLNKFNENKPKTEVFEQKKNVIVNYKDCDAQTEEEAIIEEKSKVAEYLKILNNVSNRINAMNHTSIVEALRTLLNSLKTIEIPSPTTTPELKIIDSPYKESETVVIETKNNLEHKYLNSKKTLTLKDSKETQTGLKSSDISSWDYLKIIIIEKDANIKNLTEKIEKHEEMNEMFKKQTSEFESQKKILEEFLNTGCANCKEKMKKIEAHKEVIQNLQVNITKKQETEAELEKTKTKLKESVKIITKKNSKIQELNDNLEDIMKQIEEVRYQRENLE